MLAAIVLASCVKSIPGPAHVSEDLMVFSAVASHSVKNIITTTNYPLDEPFVVDAVYYPDGNLSSEGETVMTREPVRYYFEDALWKSDSQHFWPQKGKLVFYAGSPVLPQVTLSTERGVEADWSIPTESETDIDLCFARTVENCESHSSMVPVVFNHALSQVCFKARTIRDYSSKYHEGGYIQANVIRVYLDSVKIRGLVSEGHFTQRPRGWDLNSSVTSGYTVFKREEGLELKCDRYDNPELNEIGTMLFIPQELPADAVIEEWHHADVRTSLTDTLSNVIVRDNSYTIRKSSVIPIREHCERWIMDFKYTLRLAVGIDDEESSLVVAITDWTETKEIVLGD